MKASVKKAIEEAQKLSEVHPTVKYVVMDKKERELSSLVPAGYIRSAS